MLESSCKFLHIRASKEEALQLFEALNQRSTRTWGSFPLAIFWRDNQTHVSFHWIPLGKTGNILLAFSPTLEREIMQLAQGKEQESPEKSLLELETLPLLRREE
jgi:hypothetical protein